VRRLSLRDHLDEVIADADLREHAERMTAASLEPPADSLIAHPLPAPGSPPFAASLTGAVTALSQARQPEPPPRHPEPLPPTPAPIGSAPGRSPQTFEHANTTAADNAPAVDTDAAGVPLPGGGRPVPSVARRRRRSASPLPPLPSPIDIPEDAPGRVTFIALAAAPDVVAHPVAVAEDPEPAPVPARPSFASPLDEWLPVVILGVAMLVVFIVGVVVTH